MIGEAETAPPSSRNPVLLALCLIGAAALLATGFVSHAPNRLVSGDRLVLWSSATPAVVIAVGAAGAILLAAAFARQGSALRWAVVLAATAVLLMLLYAAGEAAALLAASSPPAARTSLGPAFWIASLCAMLAIVDALQRARAGPGARMLVAAGVGVLVAALASSGALDELSLSHEYATRRGAFAVEIGVHCQLVAAAVGPALIIGVPLGLLATRRPAAQTPVFATLNVLQTIPSVALFGLLIAPLSALAQAVPALAAVGVRGVGFTPAAIALVLYSLLPVVRNTQAGIAGVDRTVIDAARGMGFTSAQIFWRVELPLASPVLLAGLRIVLVQAIGLAVVAALIGAGGLGTFVFQGLGQYALDLILLGALPAILLALAAHFALSLLILLVQRRRLR